MVLEEQPSKPTFIIVTESRQPSVVESTTTVAILDEIKTYWGTELRYPSKKAQNIKLEDPDGVFKKIK